MPKRKKPLLKPSPPFGSRPKRQTSKKVKASPKTPLVVALKKKEFEKPVAPAAALERKAKAVPPPPPKMTRSTRRTLKEPAAPPIVALKKKEFEKPVVPAATLEREAKALPPPPKVNRPRRHSPQEPTALPMEPPKKKALEPPPTPPMPLAVLEREVQAEPPPPPVRKTQRDKFERTLSHPKVSIVIANHNNVDALWHCLFALKTQTYPIHEIVLVDNASEDASLKFVRTNYPRVTILECLEDFGPAMGFNLGVKTATGDLVLLVRPEMVLAPKSLAHLVKDFQHHWPKYGAMTAPISQGQGTVNTFGTCEKPRTLNILGNPMEGYFQEPFEVFHPQGGPVLFPRYLAAEGPFDSDMVLGFEDAYMGWKFRLLHHAIGNSLETKVFLKQAEAQTDLPEWKSVFYQTRNRWLSLLFFYEADHLLKVLPWAVGEAFWRILRSLGVGFGAFWGNLCAALWILPEPQTYPQKATHDAGKKKSIGPGNPGPDQRAGGQGWRPSFKAPEPPFAGLLQDYGFGSPGMAGLKALTKLSLTTKCTRHFSIKSIREVAWPPFPCHRQGGARPRSKTIRFCQRFSCCP